jgi:hypothetical protein
MGTNYLPSSHFIVTDKGIIYPHIFLFFAWKSSVAINDVVQQGNWDPFISLIMALKCLTFFFQMTFSYSPKPTLNSVLSLTYLIASTKRWV